MAFHPLVRVSTLLLLTAVLIGGPGTAVARRTQKAISIVEKPPINADQAVQRSVPQAYTHTAGMGSGAPANPRACGPGKVLRVDFAPAADGDGRLYGNAYGTGIVLVEPFDVFEYEIMWDNARCNCSAEFEVGSTYRLRDNGPRDALGYSPHSERNANMSTVAFRRWYKRSWPLVGLEGKYIDKFVFSAFAAPGSKVTAYFKYIRIVKETPDPETGAPVSVLRRAVFDADTEPPAVNPYFPGKITLSCQSEVIIAASSLGTPATVRLGAPFVLAGVLEPATLTDRMSAFSPDSQCAAMAPTAETFAALRRARFHRIVVHTVAVRVRHQGGGGDDTTAPSSSSSPSASLDDSLHRHQQAAFTRFGMPAPAATTATAAPSTATARAGGLMLLNVSESRGMSEFLPLPLYYVVHLPPPSALTHLLFASVLEVSVEYSVFDGRVWHNASSTVFSWQLSIAQD